MSRVVLALDTSGSFCSVAVWKAGGVLIEQASSGEGDHFERLPSLVEDVCREGGVSLNEISELRVGLGPGSFTGLRIGLSFAKGFASAQRIPLVGVCSFEAMARAVLVDEPSVQGVVVVSDARRDEVFIAAYSRTEGHGIALVAAPSIVPASQLHALPWSEPSRVWVSPLRGFTLTGRELKVGSSLARGMILCDPPKTDFSLPDIAALEPSYLRAVAAKTIAERKLGA